MKAIAPLFFALSLVIVVVGFSIVGSGACDNNDRKKARATYADPEHVGDPREMTIAVCVKLCTHGVASYTDHLSGDECMCFRAPDAPEAAR